MDNRAAADHPKAPESKPAQGGTGMPAVPHAGSGHHAHMAADFRKRFWISLVLTLPILVLPLLLQTLAGLRAAIRYPGGIYPFFVLSSAVFWYGGRPFFMGMFVEPNSRKPG
jgi:Cu2+-exporting ATPase